MRVKDAVPLLIQTQEKQTTEPKLLLEFSAKQNQKKRNQQAKLLETFVKQMIIAIQRFVKMEFALLI